MTLACRSSSLGSGPARSFTLRELLIDDTALPEGWALLSVDKDPIVSFGEEEAIEALYYFLADERKLTRGGLTVYRHRSSRAASKAYARQERGDFNLESRWLTTPPQIPPGLAFISSTADEWRLGCFGHTTEGLLEDTTICSYLARYSEFVVSFDMNAEYDGRTTVTVEELDNLVSDIDERIASYLAP
jgi:hypothetical protein